ncbi:MAG: tRNA pseudouridine(55) synthase TruB [Thermodesulfobacteriota bacterium]
MTELNKSDGMILINKPVGITSNKALGKIKRLAGIKKAGHTGTLDPFASGLLPVCINRGTKLVRYLLHKEKEYTGVIKLGAATDTLDKTGTIIKETDIPELSFETIDQAAEKFRGEIQQIPPSFSALKHNGVPLYKLARQGTMIKKDPRTVNIYELKIVDFTKNRINIKVRCSAGTYIRTLASDLAEELNTAGHLESLERTKSSSFDIKNSVNLEELEDICNSGKISEYIIPPEKIIDFIPEFKVDETLVPVILNGGKITVYDLTENIFPDEVPVRITSSNNKLVSIVRKEENSDFLKYDAVFN